jgi:hypothetical protein
MRCPHSRNPEDSSQASVEAKQWALLYQSISQEAVTENISHSKAKLS